MNFKPAIPMLRIFDEAKAKEFYVDYLGFQVDWEHRHTAELPLYLQVSRGDCLLHLSEHHGDGTPGTKLRIECDDVQAYHEGLRAKEYQYFNPHLGKQPWAKWELRLTDPFGNELIFYQAQ
ncbi:MAG: glyoxalase superfamily protein [Bacteroidota bacterium]